MLNTILLRNFVVSALVALLAPFLLPLVLVLPEVDLDASVFIKAYLVALALNFLTAVLLELIKAKVGHRQSAKAVRQLDPATEANREEGVVKWFNVSKGYGFIVRDCGGEVFVHFRSILGAGHRTLREGQRVKFIAVDGEKGLQAEEVITLT